MLINLKDINITSMLESFFAQREKFEQQEKKIRAYLTALARYLIELYNFLSSFKVFAIIQAKPRKDFYTVAFSKTNHRILNYQHQLAPPFHNC